MTTEYTAKYRDLTLRPAMADLILRRTMPFLDSVGLKRSLPHLLAEVYLQGMKDAVQACAALGKDNS